MQLRLLYVNPSILHHWLFETETFDMAVVVVCSCPLAFFYFVIEWFTCDAGIPVPSDVEMDRRL